MGLLTHPKPFTLLSDFAVIRIGSDHVSLNHMEFSLSIFFLNTEAVNKTHENSKESQS